MCPAEPPASRDRERTRRLLLEAAAHLYLERGARASLADIAARAGRTKGALTHHFPTRNDLDLALLEDAVQRSRSFVLQSVDLAENTPGKLLRGYVRALTSASATQFDLFSPNGIIAAVIASGPGRQLLEEDAVWWREAFAVDGIDLGISVAVRAAAEGLAQNVDTPFLSEEELEAARARLIEVTLRPEHHVASPEEASSE